MKKKISIFITALLLSVALYHSLYFEKLDVKKERESTKDFNPVEKVDYFWKYELDDRFESALDLKYFDSQLTDHPESLMRQHGKSVGITSTFCFLVKGTAIMNEQDADELPVEIANSNAEYSLQIKYIFGNTARDALGFFDIADFENTMDFNAVAREVNRRIRENEISKLDSLSPGSRIMFVGAVALNSERIPDEMDIVPLKIKAVQ